MKRATLFDSVSKRVKSLPDKPAPLSWYSCGPTVYDKTHLGHARNYVQVDIVQRLLKRLGYRIQHVMGVTDVDDKIILRAAEMSVAPAVVAQQYEQDFIDSMRKMNVQPPVMLGRVTEHVDDILMYIAKIKEAGFAYETNDGVYFDTTKLGSDRYNVLGGLPLEATSPAKEEDKKKSASDFALWKRRDSSLEMGWESPWGFGRPGWHIECSAIIESAFGSEAGILDVHSGGIDLAFPHHNNEIAQTCARHGCDPESQFGVFLHVGHLHIAGRKMSKSLKNFISVDEFTEDADVFRMFCLLHHYRTNTNYSDLKIADAKSVLGKLIRFVEEFSHQSDGNNSDALRWTDTDRSMSTRIFEAQIKVRQLIECDMQTQEAVHLLLQLATDVRKYVLGSDRRSARESLIIAGALELVSDFLSSAGIQSLQRHAVPSVAGESREDRAAQAAVNVRQLLKDLGPLLPKESKGECFRLLDVARDEILSDAGIQVTDQRNQLSTWKWKQ